MKEIILLAESGVHGKVYTQTNILELVKTPDDKDLYFDSITRERIDIPEDSILHKEKHNIFILYRYKHIYAGRISFYKYVKK